MSLISFGSSTLGNIDFVDKELNLIECHGSVKLVRCWIEDIMEGPWIAQRQF